VTPAETVLRDVLARHPELAAGLAEHTDEVLRIADRIAELEANPSQPPRLPGDAPEWERAYWARRGVGVPRRAEVKA
jgi:hypothetical protein